MAVSDNMSFAEWRQLEEESLREFEKWWREQHAANPEMFPLDMPPGEWDEQFRAWQSVA